MKKSKSEKRKMKKNKQSSKKNRNMATKSVSKNIKKSTLQSAVTDYVIDVISSILDEGDVDTVRTALEEHQNELQNVITKNLPKQKVVPLKKTKDPNGPKRGKSSYIFFCVDKRQEVIDANPDMSAKDIIKELGRVWREDTSDEEKKKYHKQSTTDKLRYEEEMADYTPPPNLGFVTEKKKAKRDGPKRARTAYIFFCTERRPLIKEENPDMNTKEVTSQLGVQWNALSDKEKKPYVKLAEKDKARYEKEKSELVDVEENVEEEDLEERKVNSSKNVKKKGKKSSKKKTNPRKKSGYILFCQEKRESLKEDNPDLSNQQIIKELGAMWKALSSDEQAEYNERAAEESSVLSG